MSLAIVRSNVLLLCIPQDKAVRIHQRPDMSEGAVMELIVPWQGQIEWRQTGTAV